MQFVQDNEWYKVVRTTGPAHNLLGLSFGNKIEGQVVVQPVPVGDDQEIRIAADEVRHHVLIGVMEANQNFGTQYHVEKIQFVPTDTPPTDIYRSLAKCIIERLARKEVFVQSK